MARQIRHPKVEDDPWNTVCHLEIEYANRASSGTGFLVGPRTVITAAHCVLDPKLGRAMNVTVRPARDDSIIPFGLCNTGSVDFPGEWQDALRLGQEPAEHDYGAIFLPEEYDRIGSCLKWKVFTDNELQRIVQNSEQANVIGYPIDRNPVMETDAGHLVIDSGHPLNERLLHYRIDTSEGQSGGPIIHYDLSTRTSTVYGIHSRALGDGVKVARRINPNLAGIIQLWVDNPHPRLAGALIA